MTLDELEIGQAGIIKSVGGTGALRQHLLNMGLTPGTEVTLIKVAPMGDPIELIVRCYVLTLRLEDARKITIERVNPKQVQRKKPNRYNPIPHPGAGELGRADSYHAHKNKESIPENQPITFALIGNQNSGKTTLFNRLTGANQHVGNFPGVTVDRKDGIIRRHPNVHVTDLPGIYSLSPYSSEEIVTRDFLLKTKPEGIINIVDATNIERNLYLTMQLMELRIPMVLALNMMDEVRDNGGSVRINELEAILGIPVVPISAAKNEGIDELIDHAPHVTRFRETPSRIDFCPVSDDPEDPVGVVHRAIHAAAHLLEPMAKKAGYPVRFATTKMIEGDPLIEKSFALTKGEKKLLDQIITLMEKESGLDRNEALANMRFNFIEKLCYETVVKPVESKEHRRSVAIDRILTGKYTAIPVFVAIMALVFMMSFSWIGATLSDLMVVAIDSFADLVDRGLTAASVNSVMHSLIVDGIINGVGAVLSFLPTIITLFFF
ncbi:MAG TPA: GTP-binding protein, partial [Clostridiaceae bacterium]|nr:GTP-binding protein [Clostridiaceae bacterium]